MREIVLPSGKKAVIKEGKGKDLLNAQRIAGSPDEIAYALMAELTEIEGQKVVYEDLMEMELKDVLTLQMELLGNFLPPQPGTSSAFARQPAGD